MEDTNLTCNVTFVSYKNKTRTIISICVIDINKSEISEIWNISFSYDTYST